MDKLSFDLIERLIPLIINAVSQQHNNFHFSYSHTVMEDWGTNTPLCEDESQLIIGNKIKVLQLFNTISSKDHLYMITHALLRNTTLEQIKFGFV